MDIIVIAAPRENLDYYTPLERCALTSAYDEIVYGGRWIASTGAERCDEEQAGAIPTP